jgi:hypothetical protein
MLKNQGHITGAPEGANILFKEERAPRRFSSYRLTTCFMSKISRKIGDFLNVGSLIAVCQKNGFFLSQELDDLLL